MSFPFNEYLILRIIKEYFTALKSVGSALNTTFDGLFDALDLSVTERNAFRDVIVNDKIQYMTTYSNISTEVPTVVCIMDQETQQSDYLAPADVVDESEEGYIEFGVYAINVLSKSILLTRLIAIFIKFILEHWSINNADIADMEINLDRFSPDAEYFPNELMHIHITARFRYVESWPALTNLVTAAGLIASIRLETCDPENVSKVPALPPLE